MRKKKKMSPGKIIDCKLELPPRGCSGIFPFEGCTNPTIQLDDIEIISCEGVISGRVLCDYQPLKGVTVTLTSSFPGLIFEDATPVTDSTGRFSTSVTVAPGTPITPNVIVTATAVVIGKTIRDSISLRVDCIECKNPVLSLDPIPCPVDCKGTRISGRLICDGRAIGSAAITFIIESASKRVVITPNPAITMSDGTYTATLVPFPDIDETIRITATTKIGGQQVSSVTREVTVRCVKCKYPTIKLNKLNKIDCRAIVSGKVTCDGIPQPKVPVTLTGSHVLRFHPSNPVTDENGSFSSVVTVNKGTPFQVATYTATAVLDGKTVSATNTIKAGCKKCRKPTLTLEVPCETVTCKGTKLTGELTCDGVPVRNKNISFIITASSPDVVEVQPNPAITDENGRYVTMLSVSLGVVETISVKATATIDGEQVVAFAKVTIDCQCENPKFHFKKIKKLDCKGIVSGSLSCEGFPLANEQISLSSPVISFKPSVITTDENGGFSSHAFVPPNTPFREVPYTVTAKVNGQTISDVVFVYAGCLSCKKPELTICVPDCIECEGAKVTGKFTCNGRPVRNTSIMLTVSPDVVTIKPKEVMTNEHGEYEAMIIPDSDVSEDVSIQATAVIGERNIISERKIVKIHCTCQHPEIKLDRIDEIDCYGSVSGIVCCDGEPLQHIEVTLNSPVLDFKAKIVTTDEEGRFSSEVTVPADSEFKEIAYTATANFEGELVSAKAYVCAGCLPCEKPELSLWAPLIVECRGGSITGEVICDDVPIEGIEVNFEVMEMHLKKVIAPNPAVTDDEGKYSARITPKLGMDESITFRASILWEGKRIVTQPFCVMLNCKSPSTCDGDD